MLRAVIALLMLLIPSVAKAEGRFALLIGNQGYSATVGTLKNPFNDVAVVGDALSRQGFEVLPPIKDAKRSAILGGVRDLVRRLNAAGAGAIGFIYYSGHGAAEKDTNINYLIPVDASAPGTSAFWDDSVKLDDVLRLLDGARSAAKFIVFDACRNELQLPTKDTSKGLVPVAEQQGMFNAYASAPGRTASDIGEKSGPYAAALAAELAHPGLDHLNLFQNVKETVLAATGGAQQPWESNGLGRRVYLTGQPKPVTLPVPSESEVAWRRVKDSSNTEVLENFIKQFGDTPFGGMAKGRLEEVKKQQVAIATPPAPLSPLKPSAKCDGIEITVGENERRCFKPGAGKTEYFKDCPTCPEMVVVPAGIFTMGSPASEPQRQYGEAKVQITIPAPFAVGRFAVTFDEWDACVADGGCNGYKPGDQVRDRGMHPVVSVSWHDAKAYIAWISRKTVKIYRLPSEAEREYVTRAGTTSADPYKGGGSQGEYRGHTVPVDSFEANPWGLYNVHGNVLDCTEDCWNDSNTGNPGDGRARTTGDCSKRVARGSSWSNWPQYLRSAYRVGIKSDLQGFPSSGFRLARTLAP